MRQSSLTRLLLKILRTQRDPERAPGPHVFLPFLGFWTLHRELSPRQQLGPFHVLHWMQFRNKGGRRLMAMTMMTRVRQLASLSLCYFTDWGYNSTKCETGLWYRFCAKVIDGVIDTQILDPLHKAFEDGITLTLGIQV